MKAIDKDQMEFLEILRATTNLERNAIWRHIAGQDLEINDDDKEELKKEGMVEVKTEKPTIQKIKSCRSCTKWKQGSCVLIPLRFEECINNGFKYYSEEE